MNDVLLSIGSSPTQGPPDPFAELLRKRGLPPLRADTITWLQINLGRRCNQACHHCHVDAGPNRTEEMSEATADRLIELMKSSQHLELVDLTGGAPELNAPFRRLVTAARSLGLRVIDRCNLTILSEPGQEDLAEFLAGNRVEIVASLPCYSAENVDKQRGGGVFERSISALQKLNQLGYGRGDGQLVLDLVYNPIGPTLPPAQTALEADYKTQLAKQFNIVFDSLITITNMPIARFRHDLSRAGQLDEYRALLVASFNPETLGGLMCRSLISVCWDGRLHDCDFNQMLDIPLDRSAPQTIWDLRDLDSLHGRSIRTEAHCFGCTAGAGSSCAGATNQSVPSV
jgi:radical SAM/Cys-rich protein